MITPGDQPAFNRALFHGGQELGTVGIGRAKIERRSLGRIDVPDGRVYACDPLVPVDVQPLAQRLQPADYEVVLFVAVPAEPGIPGSISECNAAAALVCSPEAPESWALALREALPSDATGYGVDSGTGSLFGTRAARQIFEGDEVSAQAIRAALHRASGAVVAVEGGGALAVFASGVGDCVYDTWLGRDARGELSMILTDFGILESADYVASVHAEWAARAARKWWQFWR